jgi:hypothetical protein
MVHHLVSWERAAVPMMLFACWLIREGESRRQRTLKTNLEREISLVMECANYDVEQAPKTKSPGPLGLGL